MPALHPLPARAGELQGAQPGEDQPADDEQRRAGGERPLEDRRRSRAEMIVLLAVLAIPFVLAVGVLREPRWYPTVDDAQSELRVRDVWTANPPLTGLGGRIGVFGADQGSHPGPVSFWSLSVPYRLLGSSSWALRAATAAVHVVGVGLVLWLAHRRGGRALLLGLAAVVAVLISAYGQHALTLPWNPYLPMLWWTVFLLGVWSLLCGDLRVLPVTVFAGSFCMQTHVSYVGLVAALTGLGAVAVASWLWVRRRARPELRRDIGWTALGIAIGAVLWFPPVAEQVTRSQGGNLGVLRRHFENPPEQPIGLGRGLDVVLANLNPWHLFTEPVIDGRSFLGGPTLPGTVFVVTWLVAVAASRVLEHKALLRLHLLLGAALVLAVGSASRIFGPPWVYLTLWMWGICAMVVLAVGWTVGLLVLRVAPAAVRPRLATLAAVGGLAVLVVFTARSTVDAATVDEAYLDAQPQLTGAPPVLVPQTVEALRDGTIPGTGPDGRYLVTWSDPRHFGSRGFTLFNELEREGFDVGALPVFRVAVTRHRVRTKAEATAEVHLAVGSDIATWSTRPGYREIASYDPAGRAGRTRYERLRDEVIEELEAQGRPELIALLDTNPGGFAFEKGMSEGLLERVGQIIEFGMPVAVLVGPPVSDG